MTCENPTYSPRGRGGLGVVQPQSGLDYPFISPSADIRYLVADFYFAYDDPGLYDNTGPAAHPLRIKWLYGIGCEENAAPPDAPTPTHTADVIIVDSQNVVVFNSTTATYFTENIWGNDYKIYEWRSADAVCRLVAYTTWAPDEANVTNYARHISPQSAVLDERAVYKMPKRVTGIKVLNTTITNAAVDLLCGYNIGTETTPNETRGLRAINTITMTAEPGLGLGRYSDCNEEPPAIVSLNGATGPDITIAATDCLWTRIDTIFNEDQTKLIAQKTNSVDLVNYPNGTTRLFLGSDCPACCSCDDYVNTGRYMNCVRDRYKSIGAVAHDVLLQHSNNIARWLEQRECRIQKPLKVVMTAQKCPEVDVIVQFCNLCETCADDVNLNIQFSTYPAGGVVTILHCHTVLSAGKAQNFPYYIPMTSPNNFVVNFGKVSAGNSADITFRASVYPAAPLTVTATVTGTKKYKDLSCPDCDGSFGPIVAGCAQTGTAASASAMVPIACDNDGKTVSVC